MTIDDLAAQSSSPRSGGQRRAGSEWSPRECVWLMVLAERRGQAILPRLRARLAARECQPDAATPDWDWR